MFGLVMFGGETMPEGMVFCYGFEDWAGDADSTPDYFSSTSYSSCWNDGNWHSVVMVAERLNDILKD